MKQVEKPMLEKNDEEIVALILGLPLERIKALKEEHQMPVDEYAFATWFVHHVGIILEELKRQDEIRVARLIPRR